MGRIVSPSGAIVKSSNDYLTIDKLMLKMEDVTGRREAHR